MDPPDLYRHPGHLFRRAQQIAVSVFYKVLGDDITPIQYALLRTVQEHPGVDQKTLAGLVALDSSTTAQTAERLEAKGLLVRRLHIAGRRQRLLHLTEAGVTQLASMSDEFKVVDNELFASFTPEERDMFIDLLQRFVDLNNAKSRAPLECTGTVKAPPKRHQSSSGKV